MMKKSEARKNFKKAKALKQVKPLTSLAFGTGSGAGKVD